MRGVLETCGERLAIGCDVGWVAELVVEGAAGELRDAAPSSASVEVVVEATRRPFVTAGWQPLTRGASCSGSELVMQNACTSGFDVHVRCSSDTVSFTARWRPPNRERVAALALRARFHLLARAVLLQYPALWWAGTRGRAPLHASGCAMRGAVPLLTAPSGIGRSTLLLGGLEDGARATGDNLAVSDGTSVWGLVEPLRVEGAGGRRMPHGRNEAPMAGRVDAVEPDRVLVLRRSDRATAAVRACAPAHAARALVTSTYMAGELRRYWAYAATLAAGTGAGPAHPPVVEVASDLTASLPCSELLLAGAPGARLAELLSEREEVEVAP
jgi:hypothetical protein